MKGVKQFFYNLNMIFCMIFSSSGLWLAAATAFLLFLISPATVTQTGATVSIIQVLVVCVSQKDIANIGFVMPSAVNIIANAGSQYIATFLPVLAAFPSVPLLLEMQKSGFGRFAIMRQSKNSYLCSCIIAGWISGGMVMLIGYVGMALPVYLLLPAGDIPPEVFVSNSPLEGLVGILGTGTVIIGQAINQFFYGAFFALPALFLVRRLHNRYLVLCIPVLLRFLYDTLMTRPYREQLQIGNFEKAQWFANWFSTSLSTAVTQPNMWVWLWLLGGLGIVLVLNCIFAGFEVDIGG